MSSKYQPLSDQNPVVADDENRRVVITDHAVERWRERTPHDCGVDMLDAWRWSEQIAHPGIAKTLDERYAPESVRVYQDADGWGVLFLVSGTDFRWDQFPWALTTVWRVDMMRHDPSRAYLNEYGPHPEVTHDAAGE
jgi:hypothetical protein